MSVNKVKASINIVMKLRRIGLDKIFHLEYLSIEDNWVKLIQKVPRVCLLASSSRGGTAVTAELLQWQGADCADPRGRLLTLPGEEKPHLILAGLAFPSRDEKFDDLSELDAQTINVSKLLEELGSEIGYPMEYCSNLEFYAIQLYRRLLLQWPVALTSIDINEAIACLTKELQTIFPDGYINSLNNRHRVLDACKHCFPFIHRSFYDYRYYNNSDEDIAPLPGECWSYEETPFVLPPPWHNATIADLEHGCLLLRDPSNAWRLPFWRTVFQKQQIDILHLVRDPRESVQGLCDGWNYSFGFQTMPSNESLDIPGYTDHLSIADSKWKFNRLNFSICKDLSQKIFDEQEKLSLVQVCAYQWKDAHESIIKGSERLGLSRTVVNFSDLRRYTEETFRNICICFHLEFSKSGISFARSFKDNWVMVTPPAILNGSDRWKSSPFSNEIKALFSTGYFDKVIMTLGLNNIFSDETNKTSSGELFEPEK
jgi:hypothetical protein